MEGILVPIGVVAILFIGLPWLILHYMTQQKRAQGLTLEDEKLLDEMHELARRLDDRVETIERILTAENPRWRDAALPSQRPELKEVSHVRSSH